MTRARESCHPDLQIADRCVCVAVTHLEDCSWLHVHSEAARTVANWFSERQKGRRNEVDSEKRRPHCNC